MCLFNIKYWIGIEEEIEEGDQGKSEIVIVKNEFSEKEEVVICKYV